MHTVTSLLWTCLWSMVIWHASSFVATHEKRSTYQSNPTTSKESPLLVLEAAKLSELPPGISPFEKSLSKNIDIQGDFRARALNAVQAATRDGVRLQEVEFPPLLGGDKSKSQFDDFDNVQELNQNRDWCIQWLPQLSSRVGKVWFILPDLKECELAKEEWTGQRYRDAAVWTTIEAVTKQYANKDYSKPWGATIASTVNKALAGEGKNRAGLLGNEGALDDVASGPSPSCHLICQPGNGGPVEDWINCEVIHTQCNDDTTTTIIVNGALDKVRNGYYPGVFFPKLASTADRFYKKFTSVFYLKPISDKGVYGWLYRVYPEPWQVVLQTVKEKGNSNRMYVENTVVYISEQRPSFAHVVEKLVSGAVAAKS